MVQPLWTALERVVLAHAGAGLVLCVSGGPDSRALLEAVARWPGRECCAIHVASVDHHTRAGSGADATRVIDRAHALGFDGTVVSVHAAPDEAALRTARYQALVSLAGRHGLCALVTGHHLNDVAEGVVLGLLGEGGGALVPCSKRDAVWLLRPFLSVSRAQLALALGALDVRDWTIDPETRSARARLRNAGLMARFDAARLADLAARAADDDAALDAMVHVQVDGADLVVPMAAAAVLRRGIQRALAQLASGDVRASGRAVDGIVAMAREGRTGVVVLAGGVTARVEVLCVRLAVGRVPAYANAVVAFSPLTLERDP